MKKKKLVICGGGSSAHTLIPLLNNSVFDVSIYTSRPNEWSKNVELEYQDTSGKILESYSGKLSLASNDPSLLFSSSDYIILCMPVYKYREALHTIAPYINKEKEVFIGTVYGQGGFNWMVDEIKRKFSLSNIVTFAFGLIPWICRTIKYGSKGVTYGPKATNYAAVFPNHYFKQVNDEFFNQICFKWFGKGEVEQSENFLSLTLSVDNQIIHTSRCFGLYKVYGKTWESEDQVPMFYKDYDETSAKLLADLDADYSKIRDRIISLHPEKDYRYMLNYLDLERFSYKSHNTDIKESFIHSETLVTIKTPIILNQSGTWEIDRHHRFFMDDIYYGVCIAKWIAQKLKIKVPTIDGILQWAQMIREEKFIDANNNLILDSENLNKMFKSGIPCFYGYNLIDDIID